MDRLKNILFRKVKGSSLVETIVATVVIMIVFGIAVATIGNILERNVKSSTSIIDKELNKLVYLYQNKKIQVPEIRELDKWTIELKKEQEGNLSYVVFNAKHKVNLKEKSRKILER